MTPELQAFINHFKDEGELRSAIEGLLSKQEGCQGVRNLHRTNEKGKDLTFLPYGSPALCDVSRAFIETVF
jgi:hypothetical protein